MSLICSGGGGVAAVAQGGGDDRPDLRIGEVGGFEAAGDTAFGEDEADADVFGPDVAGGVALFGPADGQDDVAAGIGGAAEGNAEPEQVPQRGGDDVRRRPLGGGDDDDPGGA